MKKLNQRSFIDSLDNIKEGDIEWTGVVTNANKNSCFVLFVSFHLITRERMFSV